VGQISTLSGGTHMETYNPTEDIRNYSFREPWTAIAAENYEFHTYDIRGHELEGARVHPIAYNAIAKQILLHILGDNVGYPLAVCSSQAPPADIGEVLGYYENIGHFEFSEYAA
jgi:hypothetical protein